MGRWIVLPYQPRIKLTPNNKQYGEGNLAAVSVPFAITVKQYAVAIIYKIACTDVTSVTRAGFPPPRE